MKHLKTLVLALTVLLLSSCGGDDRALHIGSKNFTEQLILAEIIAQLAEYEGITVRRSIPYGDTFLNQEGIKSGDIDLYPEYNGTGLILLGQPPIADGDQAYDAVKRLFDPLGLVWGQRFGFSNDYAIAMRSDRATALGIKTISDLSKLQGGVRLVVDDGFVGRPLDGLDAMMRRYGLEKADTQIIPVEEKERIYQTLLDGKVDVAEVFTTDGYIDDYGLVTLEDDLTFFPIYQPAPLVRKQALEAFPQLKGILDKLAGVISEVDMRRMNRLVDSQGQTFQSVAQNFLIGRSLIPAGEAAEVSEAEKMPVAVGALAELGDSSLRAVRAIREVFPKRDVEVLREANPLQAIAEGRARLAVASSDQFFTLSGDSPFPIVNDKAEALGVVKYRLAHIITKASNPAASISDLKRIGVGPENGTSHHTAGLVVNALGLSDKIELVTNNDIDATFLDLADNKVNGLFLMAASGHAKVLAMMSPSDYHLLPLSEWKNSNSMLRFPFLRLAQIPGGLYAGQDEAVETISAQVVLAGPAPAADAAVGESGPGYIPGVVQSLPLPVPPSTTLALAEALGNSERVDPKLPTAAALAPQRPTPPPSINVAPSVSVTNLIAILFLVYMLYLFVREEKNY